MRFQSMKWKHLAVGMELSNTAILKSGRPSEHDTEVFATGGLCSSSNEGSWWYEPLWK
jgi:hypothetical protein